MAHGQTPFFFDPIVQAGTYHYAFGPFDTDPCCGPTGSLTIANVTDDSAIISISNVASAPAYNAEDHYIEECYYVYIEECYYVQIPGVEDSPWLMLLGI